MISRKLLLSLALAPVLLGCDKENVTVVQGNGSSDDPAAFAFRTEPPAASTRVDRMGGPATTTALLMPGPSGGARRQQANATDPVDDTQYAAEYIATLKVLQFELGPVLTQLQLAACGVPGATAAATNVDKCVAQATAGTVNLPAVIPDVLRLDTSVATSYPNGRNPNDPVIDRLLAVALLNLTDASAKCGGGACTINTLASLPLNTTTSTPPALAQFPYLNNVQLNPPPAADP